MKKLNRVVAGFICLALLVTGIISGTKNTKADTKIPDIIYAGHVQNVGWMNAVKNGQTAGTTGKSLRLEAFAIALKNNEKSMIQYRAHVENVGWQNWVNSGSISGSVGKGLRMEAIQIKLLNEYADQYDIYYRVHVPNYGWLGYAKNGAIAGSTGISQRIEAIQIQLVKKNQAFQTNGAATVTKPSLSYQAHCQDIGWMGSVTENKTAGTTGKSYRMEALKINIGTGGVTYRAHVSNVGWQGWKTTGQVMGTTGQNRAIEAVQIKLSGNIANYYDIYYRMHVAGMGWLGWAKNGETAGTTGSGIRAEAIQIQLVLKCNTINRQGAAYYDKPAQNNGVTVGNSTYDNKVTSFLNDSRWKNGASWTGNKRPMVGSGNGTGCYAYANDFMKYVYGISGECGKGSIPFYSPASIKSGDIIKVTGSQHWFVVLYRNGNQLITAEGNWDGKVVVNNGAYTVSGNTLYRNGKKFRTFSVGYHYR
ncbi:MAG: hypothetical protein K6G30_11870 [Acetatifactor sp.]|nr:hypothetical protein [Acetatifactor sp.]